MMTETMSDQDFPFGTERECPCGGDTSLAMGTVISIAYRVASTPHVPAAECQQCGFVWGVA
jgi:hypothetical protein